MIVAPPYSLAISVSAAPVLEPKGLKLGDGQGVDKAWLRIVYARAAFGR